MGVIVQNKVARVCKAHGICGLTTNGVESIAAASAVGTWIDIELRRTHLSPFHDLIQLLH